MSFSPVDVRKKYCNFTYVPQSKQTSFQAETKEDIQSTQTVVQRRIFYLGATKAHWNWLHISFSERWVGGAERSIKVSKREWRVTYGFVGYDIEVCLNFSFQWMTMWEENLSFEGVNVFCDCFVGLLASLQFSVNLCDVWWMVGFHVRPNPCPSWPHRSDDSFRLAWFFLSIFGPLATLFIVASDPVTPK